MRSRVICLALATAGLMCLPARAALFEDDEARRAIIELRAKVTALEEARSKLQAQINDSVDPLRRTVLDLQNQIEALRADMAKLRGTNEQLA